MSRFVGFGDKSWDNFKNFFQTQGFEFLFLSQSAAGRLCKLNIAETPVLKLNRPFARKPPAAIVSESARAVARHSQNPRSRICAIGRQSE